MKSEKAKKNVESKWIGKKVLVKGEHPHTGETGEVIGFDVIQVLKKGALKIKGRDCEFFVFDPTILQIIK